MANVDVRNIANGVVRLQVDDMIKAVTHIRPMNNGSRAQLVLTDNREEYVIKLMGNPRGD